MPITHVFAFFDGCAIYCYMNYEQELNAFRYIFSLRANEYFRQLNHFYLLTFSLNYSLTSNEVERCYSILCSHH